MVSNLSFSSFISYGKRSQLGLMIRQWEKWDKMTGISGHKNQHISETIRDFLKIQKALYF